MTPKRWILISILILPLVLFAIANPQVISEFWAGFTVVFKVVASEFGFFEFGPGEKPDKTPAAILGAYASIAVMFSILAILAVSWAVAFENAGPKRQGSE